MSDGLRSTTSPWVMGHEKFSPTRDRYTHAFEAGTERARGVLTDFSLTYEPDEGREEDDGTAGVAVR
jgi:hypothetical protein